MTTIMTNVDLKTAGVSYDLFEEKKLTHPTWLDKKTVWDFNILSLNPPTNYIGQVHTLPSRRPQPVFMQEEADQKETEEEEQIRLNKSKQ